MNHCRETAGFLFKRNCDQLASRQCRRCGRPVCDRHFRLVENVDTCISCVREAMRDQRHRGTYAHLADDPYFYWYYHSAGFEDDFTAEDYALFDAPGGDWDGSFDRDWGGS